MTGVRWTPDDNLIGQTELVLSTILTEELTARPAVTLSLMFASVKVQARVLPILTDLETTTGKLLKMDVTEYREPGRRRVMVTISDRFAP